MFIAYTTANVHNNYLKSVETSLHHLIYVVETHDRQPGIEDGMNGCGKKSVVELSISKAHKRNTCLISGVKEAQCGDGRGVGRDYNDVVGAGENIRAVIVTFGG